MREGRGGGIIIQLPVTPETRLLSVVLLFQDNSLILFDSEILVHDLPFGKQGNDTSVTNYGLRKWFYLWLSHDY